VAPHFTRGAADSISFDAVLTEFGAGVAENSGRVEEVVDDDDWPSRSTDIANDPRLP
jgi:hypothetical protein